MKRVILFLAISSVLVLATTKTKSYVRTTISDTNGAGIAWNLTNPHTAGVTAGKINYEINQAGSDDVEFSKVKTAVEASFQSWEDIPTAAIAFNELPSSNLSSIDTTDGRFPVFWLENSTTIGNLNIAGALAVTVVTRNTSGPNIGEITDANMVLNGNDFPWTTEEAGGALDIQEVVTHEVGHSLGLDHSPISSSTMFRQLQQTNRDIIKSRTLSTDDKIAASVIYPKAGFVAATGKIGGTVTAGGTPVFGAHIVAHDPNGIVIASVLSKSDGTYLIEGLNPGVYTVFAQPLSAPGGYFTKDDLNSGLSGTFYNSINTNFLTTANQSAAVNAGVTTTQNFAVTAGTPGFSIIAVTSIGAVLTGFTPSRSGTNVNQGDTQTLVGVYGPGLPQTGSPFTIGGVAPGLPSGITVGPNQFFTDENTEIPADVALIDVTATAVPGPRDLIITNAGGQRAIISGGVEIIGNNPSPFVGSINPQSIVAGGGQQFTLTVNGSSFVYGSIVQWNGSTRPTFFASPTQLTATIPASDVAAQGTAAVTISSPTPGGGVSNTIVFSINPAGKTDQTITFDPIASPTFNDPPIALNATASSHLPVSFSIVNGGTGSGMINGNNLTILGAGTIIIQADQEGNGAFNPAPSVQQTVTVKKANQTISFPQVPDKTFGDNPFNINATASSGLDVTFSVDSGPASVSGNAVTLNGAGQVTVRADQAGNANFNAAPGTTRTFSVARGSQTITFDPLGTKTFTDPPFALIASASSSLPVSFSIAPGGTGNAAINGNTLTITGAGTIFVKADQIGDTNFNPAQSVQQTLTVTKGNQAISFLPIPNQVVTNQPFFLQAAASSTLAVTFNVTAGANLVSLSGTQVNLLGAGDVTIQASQSGNSNFNAAPPVSQSFTIAKGTALLTLNTHTQIADGTPKVATVTTSPPGLSGVIITYNGSTNPPTAVGSYAVSASLNNPNFNGNVVTGTLRLVNFTPTAQNVDPGTSQTASLPPAGSSPGISTTLNHTAGGVTANLTVGVYSGNPTDRGLLDVGGGFTDVKVTNSNSGDTATVNFYYPPTITGSNETQLQLFYFTGFQWSLVKDNTGSLPTKNTTDNLDGTTSGGRFTVTLNNSTSSPRVSQLTGTFFSAALAIMGDCDLSGVVNISDLLFMANSLAGNVTLTPTQKGACDVFNDNKNLITVQDLFTLANFLAGNTQTLPVNTGGPVENPGDTVPEALFSQPLDRINLIFSNEIYRARLNEFAYKTFFDRPNRISFIPV